MRKLLIILTISFILLPTNLSIFAQQPSKEESKATLKETLDWLKQYIPTGVGRMQGELIRLGNNTATNFYELSNVNYSGCRLSWIKTSEVVNYWGTPNEKRAEVNDKYVVPLEAVDPLSIKIESLNPDVKFISLTLTATYKKKAFTSTRLNKTNDGKEVEPVEIEEVDIYLPDENRANRVKRALTHAIKLCGGKVDPF